MKVGKKIGAALLAIMLSISCASVVAYAADGNISFTDPETAVGEMVDVKCAVRSTGGEIGEVDMTLSYDSESLRFDSGDGVTKEGDGTLSYKSSGGSTEVAFTMKFQALKEGSGKVSISSATVNSGYGGTMSMDEGDSTVTIAEGDPSKIQPEEDASEEGGKKKKKKKASAGEVQVTVNGTTYALAEDFADADIPAGYSRTSVTFEGEERQMVTSEAGNICLAYLRDSGDVGDFFIYNQEDATFSPYEEISISDTTKIIVLSDTSKVKLPDTYKEAGLTLNDKEFPVWHDQEQEGYYVMYAMNNSGETGYYQYDSKEGTYQRVQISAKEKSQKKESSGFGGKLGSFLSGSPKIAMILFGGAGAVVLLIILVLAVKLHNRNVELDDLYDEYGIDPEDDEPPVKEHVQAKEKKALFGRRKEEDEDDFDDEDDFEEDDELDEIGISISKMNLDEDDFDEDDFDEEDDPDEDVFSDKKLERYDTKTIRESMVIADMDDGGDLDDLLEDLSGKKPGHQEEDDAFKVNFVDLD